MWFFTKRPPDLTTTLTNFLWNTFILVFHKFECTLHSNTCSSVCISYLNQRCGIRNRVWMIYRYKMFILNIKPYLYFYNFYVYYAISLKGTLPENFEVSIYLFGSQGISQQNYQNLYVASLFSKRRYILGYKNVCIS